MRVCRAFALAAVFVGAGASSRADSVRGIVQSVDADARKVVVKPEGSGDNVDLSTTDATVIRTDKGVPMELPYLRKGDAVGVSYANGVATQVLVRQVPLVGILVKTDPDEKTFDMTPKGEEKDLRVTTIKETTFETYDGKVLKLQDLKPGDGISVRFNGPRVARVVVSVKPPEVTGYIKSISADLQSLVVTEVGTNVDAAVTVDDETVISTNDGKSLTIKQLKKGDGVGIATEKGVARQIVVNVKP